MIIENVSELELYINLLKERSNKSLNKYEIIKGLKYEFNIDTNHEQLNELYDFNLNNDIEDLKIIYNNI